MVLTIKDDLEPGLTMCVPYYRDPDMFAKRLDDFVSWDRPTFRFDLIFVDDGTSYGPTPTQNLEESLGKHAEKLEAVRANGFRVSAYETTVDIPWNMSTLNLGLEMSGTSHFMLCDMDSTFTPEQFRVFAKVFTESIMSEPENETTRVHTFGNKWSMEEKGKKEMRCDSLWVVRRNILCKVGAWDEDFSGHYGQQDVDLNTRFSRHGHTHLLHWELDTSTYMPIHGQGAVTRDNSRNRELLLKKLESHNIPMDHIRSPWRQIQI